MASQAAYSCTIPSTDDFWDGNLLMTSETLSENLLCPSCDRAINTSKTIGLPNSKRVRCPKCTEAFLLGDARAAAKVQIVPAQVIPQLPAVAIPPAPPATTEIARSSAPRSSEMSRFMADGQNTEVILKLLEKVKEICTSTEEVLYMAVQERPLINFSPDAVVLTNRRFIVFRPKMLNRLDFKDCLWLHAGDVHMQENLIGATITFTGLNGNSERIEYLPRKQARKIYRIAQEKEEEMIELRRERKMEEQRSGASNINVTTPVISSTQQSNSDPVLKLQQIKQMMESGLISQAEYDQKKDEILRQM